MVSHLDGGFKKIGTAFHGWISTHGASPQRHLCFPLYRKENPIEEIARRLKGGPSLALSRLYANRTRVQVTTRHRSGVRGWARGTIVAVDKHWNLVLRDVDEEYTVLLKSQKGKRIVRHQEKRRRNLQQVFIAGNSIVLISISQK